jgi:hypothetical protein
MHEDDVLGAKNWWEFHIVFGIEQLHVLLIFVDLLVDNLKV